jgi:class 3 adenylate cyclase
MALLEGELLMPYAGGSAAAVAEVIDEFLGGGETQNSSAEAPSAVGLVTILFTDVGGSSALTDRLGDAAAREVLREHERITREALAAHGGSEVKTMGDGFMASFGSATRALECAIAIERAFAGPGPTVGAQGLAPLHPDDPKRTDTPIRVRIGLNAGEPIAEDDPGGRSDLFGTAVIVAARIAAQAHGGEILVSDVVRQLVAGKTFLFNDRGEHALKGFENPVRVYEVSWHE